MIESPKKATLPNGTRTKTMEKMRIGMNIVLSARAPPRLARTMLILVNSMPKMRGPKKAERPSNVRPDKATFCFDRLILVSLNWNEN